MHSLLRMPTWMSPLLMKSHSEYSLYVSFLYTWETFSHVSEIAMLKGSYVFKSTRYCQTTLLYLLPPELLCFTFFLAMPLGMWDFGSHQDNLCPLWWKCGVLNTGSLGTGMLRLLLFVNTMNKKLYLIFICTFISLIIGEVEYLFKFCGLTGFITQSRNQNSISSNNQKSAPTIFLSGFLVDLEECSSYSGHESLVFSQSVMYCSLYLWNLLIFLNGITLLMLI